MKRPDDARRLKKLDQALKEGWAKQECMACGYNLYRHMDFLSPLQLVFKDFNENNMEPSNITVLCYNCYFMMAPDHWDLNKPPKKYVMPAYVKEEIKKPAPDSIKEDKEDIEDLKASFYKEYGNNIDNTIKNQRENQ